MTKADRIRKLLARGMESRAIADRLDTTVAYVGVVRWNDNNPGVKAEWQAAYRERHPAFYHAELDAQRRARIKRLGRPLKRYKTKRYLERRAAQ